MATIQNTGQLFTGGRRPSRENLCDLLAVTREPAVTIAGSNIEFDAGTLEINGMPFAFDAGTTDFDFANLGTLLTDGNYVLSAVPAYDEPANANAAIAAGLNYYVYNDERRQGFARPVVDPAVVAAVDSYGGYNALQIKYIQGCLSDAERAAFLAYEKARVDGLDPRCSLKCLKPTGFEYVLTEVSEQDNSAKCNAVADLTECEFNRLRAQIGEFRSEVKYMITDDVVATYANTPWLILKWLSYPSLADAEANVNGVERPLPPFGTTVGGTGWNRVYEASYPSDLPMGQYGNMPKMLRLLTRKHSDFLGRVNPIYMDALKPNAGVCMPNGATRLTSYGNPLPLIEVEVVGRTVTLIKEIFDSYVK